MTHALIIRKLRKVYSNGYEALKGIDLEVKQGDFFALLGPNGAGKSTTIGIISSLVNKSSGTVIINGHDIGPAFQQAKRHVGIVPQEFNFNPFETVKNIVMCQAGYYGISAKNAEPTCRHFLNKLGLWDKRDIVASKLSGGMKRRLMIARALVHQPKLLILDEPTAGVDIELRRSLWEFLRQLNASGVTVILTTHYLEEAEKMCRNVAIINHGEIIENTSMHALLNKLNTETILLDTREPVGSLPEKAEYKLKKYDDYTLEVEVNKSQGMNNLFGYLSEHDICVTSMRNKANRLEELFVDMTNKQSTLKNA